MVHLGERLNRSKYGWRANREQYAIPSRRSSLVLDRLAVGEEYWSYISPRYRDEDHREYTDGYLLGQRDLALMNYDLSMLYFSGIDTDDFEAGLQELLAAERRLRPVSDLHDWDGVQGVYVMVFDDCHQFYVGESMDIRRRVKRHWSERKQFDRLLWGYWWESIPSVDTFRALDNTRVFALKSTASFNIEERLERKARKAFCLNRIPGGALDEVTGPLALVNARHRTLDTDAPEITPAQCSALVNEARALCKALPPGLGQRLASMDTGLHTLQVEDGSLRLWSLRAEIASAACVGQVDTGAHREFLSMLGSDTDLPE